MTLLSLPWPPSVNRYWRHPTRGALAGRRFISAEGRAYRECVTAEVLASLRAKQIGRVALVIDAFPPDARRRDLDNLLKALLDSLQHAGLVEDDSPFDTLTIRRQAREAGGRVQLQIEPHGDSFDKEPKGAGRKAAAAVLRTIC